MDRKIAVNILNNIDGKFCTTFIIPARGGYRVVQRDHDNNHSEGKFITNDERDRLISELIKIGNYTNLGYSTKRTSNTSAYPMLGYNLHVKSGIYVKNGFSVQKCPGEAHSNAFIDNCMLCAPRWGWVIVKD